MPSGGGAMRCCYPVLGPKETGPGESAHTLITVVLFVSQRRNDFLWAVTPFGAAFQECVTHAPFMRLAAARRAFGHVNVRSETLILALQYKHTYIDMYCA